MNSALSSAFWLYVQDSIKQEEIDIFEICGRHDSSPSYPKTYFATSHYIIKTHNLQISDHVEHIGEQPWAERYFVAGFKWTRDELVWYVDGKEIRRRKNDFWHSPETINFDSEAFHHGGDFRLTLTMAESLRLNISDIGTNLILIAGKTILINDMK